MKRLALASLALFVAIMACSPFVPPISAADSQATAMAQAKTLAALTSVSEPTRRSTRTPLSTATALAAVTETASPTSTSASDGSLSAPPPATISATAGGSPSATPSSTATATATFSGTITATYTFTPGVLLYGTIPPAVPYGFVTLRNLTNDMVYISFKCVIDNGLTSILEYPVYSVVKEKLPAGPCHWKAFVKGQEFNGDIHVKKFEEYTFTFKPKKVLITQP